MQNSFFFIGIDVSMNELCVATDDRHTRKFPHTLEGIAKLHRWASSRCNGLPLWYAVESTGVYSHFLAFILVTQHAATISILNPRRTRDHARAAGFRSKTDSQDALAIYDYATKQRIHPWRPAPQTIRQLGQLMDQIDRLKQLQRQTRNWQHFQEWVPDLHPVLPGCNQALADCYQQQLQKLELAIQELIEADQEVREQIDLLKSITSVGDKTARLLLTLTRGELADRTPKELTAFSGLAPAQHQSGTSVNRQGRIDKQGCSRLRAALYMCCVSGIEHNPHLRILAERLKTRRINPLFGKKLMVPLMRKLLLIARAVLVSGKPYDPSLAEI